MTSRQPTPAPRPFRPDSSVACRGWPGQVLARLLARSNAGLNRWLVNEISTALPVPHTVTELGYGFAGRRTRRPMAPAHQAAITQRDRKPTRFLPQSAESVLIGEGSPAWQLGVHISRI